MPDAYIDYDALIRRVSILEKTVRILQIQRDKKDLCDALRAGAIKFPQHAERMSEWDVAIDELMTQIGDLEL